MTPVITITGADDRVPIVELVQLSDHYPFVEWGILYSEKRIGTPRYPSADWITALRVNAVLAPMNLSLHLCGRAARKVLGGGWGHLERIHSSFQRIQLNGYDAKADDSEQLYLPWLAMRTEFILQVQSADDLPRAIHAATLVGGSVLFDPSGGTGVAPDSWPQLPRGKVGCAGGLTPETAWPTYQKVREMGASWVDLESGVRTDDRFDLAKVRATLESFAAGCTP